MSDFRFAAPEWAHALWAVLAFTALLFWLDRRGGGALARLVAAAMQPRLVERPSAWRRRGRAALLGLALAALVLALMRPQWGLRYEAAPRVGAEIMICLDVSKSMLAEDAAPNRLERAKAEIADLLPYLDGDQVGLIAFAGRASVLAPLTPDFSFLRLVLDGVGPHSVARGGTKLEEPIRKAVAGFGPPGEASRAILLITDGEDHDSFPLDAARAAAEAGIRIVAVGFGDETGSEIYATDPRSGARALLRDADGRPVRSRLDGALLRELALATEGAYVPAGTGVLDLESIVERHIAPLTRGRLDPRGRPVREEGYQWAVLLALVCLVSSAAATSGRGATAAALLLATLLAPAAPASAQPVPEQAAPPAGAPPAAGVTAGEGETADGRSPGGAPSDAPEASPRESYNAALAALEAGDLEEAERGLLRARREARGDGALRFRASYNLGVVAVRRADAREAEAPEEALDRLHEAADWFRDAAGLDPEDADARHNLEVALRRALLLADRLARDRPTGLDADLRALADGQRALLARVAELLARVGGDPDPHAADRHRQAFRDQSAEQRVLLSDADRIAADAGEERAALEARPDAEGTPEDGLRLAQLESVLAHLHRARERMGQSRSQLRLRQGARAYRRAAAALDEVKRALDALREPVAVLDRLIRDASGVSAETGTLAASRLPLAGAEDGASVPAWLDLAYLRERQLGIAERAAALGQRLLAALEADAAAPAAPAGEEALAALGEAQPLVEAGAGRFARAARAVESDDLPGAVGEQRAGIAALRDARERFLDARALLEALYADEVQIDAAARAEGEEAAAVRAEILPALRSAQERNLARAERLARRLEAERVALGAAQAGPQAPPDAAGDEAAAAQRQRYELAGELLSEARTQMQAAASGLGGAGAPAASLPWAAVREATGRAVGQLESMRRLFFSAADHVRELALEQLDLADATQRAAALAEAGGAAPVDEAVGPLVPRQEELAQRAVAIADALEEQSRREGGLLEGEPEAQETSRRLREAGEHVLFAQGEMESAARQLAQAKPSIEEGRARQDAALAELEQALALLVPPEQQPGEGERGEDGSSGGQGDEEREQGEARAQLDPAHLLQGVRDREAQRRRERAARGAPGSEAVEKDW